MKKMILFLLVALAAGMLFAEDATILRLDGSVEIKIPGGDWAPAQVGQSVSIRSQIATGFGSRAWLSIGGMELTLQPLTRMAIADVEQSDASAVSLQAGRLRATRPAVRERQTVNFQVRSPVATAAVRGTDFMMTPDFIETFEGLVSYTQNDATVYVHPGSESRVGSDGTPVNPAAAVNGRWSVSIGAGPNLDDSDDFGDDGSSGGLNGWAVVQLR